MKKQSARRAKGTGSLFKRNGKFVYQWNSITGKVKTKTLRASSHEDALKEINNIVETETQLQTIDSKISYMHQVAEAKALLHVCRTPLSQIEDAFFEHPSAPIVSIKHRQNYHSVLLRLVSFAEKHNVKTVADFSEELAQEFLTYNWKRGISAKTYNSNLDIVKCVFRLLCKDQSPFESFKKKSSCAETRQAFTPEQLQKIWKTLTNASYHMLHKEEMCVLYKLALYTGARCGDLCLLRWSSVDMQNRVIRFIPHKTLHTSHKVVEIPIGPVLWDALSKIEPINEYVLPNVAKRYQYNPSFVSHDTKKLLIASGLTPNDEGTTRRLRAVSRLSFHGFRHTAATMLIANGVNPLIVRDLLGHTTVDMTSRYTHISLESKQKAVQALPALDTPECTTTSHSLAALLPTLSRPLLEQLGRWLDENLSANQRSEILNFTTIE